jgi:Cu2+-containing amine oxidase
MLPPRRTVSSRCKLRDLLVETTYRLHTLRHSINPSKINPISGRPVGYKLVPEPSQLMLAHPDSIAYQVSTAVENRARRYRT